MTPEQYKNYFGIIKYVYTMVLKYDFRIVYFPPQDNILWDNDVPIGADYFKGVFFNNQNVMLSPPNRISGNAND